MVIQNNLPVAPLINQNAVYVDAYRQQTTMAVVILVLNIITPFSLGTFVFMCCYHPKDKKDAVHAFCHIAFTILAYVMLIIFLTTIVDSRVDDLAITLLLFFIFFTISYLWGLVFGGILLCKIRSVPVIIRMPVVTTTANVHHANV